MTLPRAGYPGSAPPSPISDPSRFYRTEYVTLAQNQEILIVYDAVPDQISVRPAVGSIVVDYIEVRARGAQGGGAEQLRGTGPLVIPGISKQVWIRSNDVLALTLIVTAQRGYAPLSVVMPTTLTAAGGTILDIPSDGWINDLNGWTFASAISVIAPGDMTSIYQKGRRVRWKQAGGWRYAYCGAGVFAAGQTTIPIYGGSTYPVLNAAITDIWWSPVQCPTGFPHSFLYACAWTATGVAPAIGNGQLVATFNINGDLVTISILWVGGGTTTYGTGSWGFSLPIARIYAVQGAAWLYDTTGGMSPAATDDSSSTNLIRIVEQAGAGWVTNLTPWTWAVGDAIRMGYTYTF